jgi:hypothetical protein
MVIPESGSRAARGGWEKNPVSIPVEDMSKY